MSQSRLDDFIRGLERLLDDGPATLERYARRKPGQGQGHFQWEPDKHPRGHEGNAGQFAAKGDGKPAATLDDKPFKLKDGGKDRPKQGSLLEGKPVKREEPKTETPKPTPKVEVKDFARNRWGQSGRCVGCGATTPYAANVKHPKGGWQVGAHVCPTCAGVEVKGPTPQPTATQHEPGLGGFRRNDHPGYCADCSAPVGAGSGYLVHKAPGKQGKWGVLCPGCHKHNLVGQ